MTGLSKLTDKNCSEFMDEMGEKGLRGLELTNEIEKRYTKVDQDCIFDWIASKLTDDDCKKFTDEMGDKGLFDSELMAEMQERFTRGEQDCIMRWLEKDTDEKLAGSISGCTPAQFVERVNNSNFHDRIKNLKLISIQLGSIRPAVPMGIDAETGITYRLDPDAQTLRPQTWDYPDSEIRQVIACSYLGVNTNVQPPKSKRNRDKLSKADELYKQSGGSRRRENLPHESTKTTETGSYGPGFEFHQIGALQYKTSLSEAEVARRMELSDEDPEWADTGFHLVAEIDESGRLKDFWIIYNMWRQYDSHDEEWEIADWKWGSLPESRYQFSLAKLSPRSAFGDAEANVTWEDQIDHAVELVRCCVGSRGEILRLTVEEEKMEDLEEKMESLDL